MFAPEVFIFLGLALVIASGVGLWVAQGIRGWFFVAERQMAEIVDRR